MAPPSMKNSLSPCLISILFFLSTLSACSSQPSYHHYPANPHTNSASYRLINIAQTYLGTPYHYGGNTYEGIDCSGLIANSFKQLNIYLPRTAHAQAQKGYAVHRNELKQGDLVFFKKTATARTSHAGIMINDHEFIHASSSKGVIITPLNNPYWARHRMQFKRVLPH